MHKMTFIGCLLFTSLWMGIASDLATAQGPPMRRHRATQRRELQLVQADQQLPRESQVQTTEQGDQRILTVNSLPNHLVGRFPNRGNPHAIREIQHRFQMPISPQSRAISTPLQMGWNFGVAVNGVVLDPGAAEFWMGDRRIGWQYEALGGAVALGLDTNHAHVQPDGKYHYHGIPTGLLSQAKDQAGHSPLIGWAADGFPIYALRGYSDPKDPESKVVELKSSYLLKKGNRPGNGQTGPTGKHDGTFVNDYQYLKGEGDLDECNGRFCVTPEFPKGTYAYFLTEDWPVIPRRFRGEPDSSFQFGPGGRGQGPGGPPGFNRPAGPGGRRLPPSRRGQ